MELRGIEELIDRLAFRIETLIKERDELRRSVSRLNACACERDKECVLTRRELNRTLEEIYEASLRHDKGESDIETKLENLNERLLALVEHNK